MRRSSRHDADRGPRPDVLWLASSIGGTNVMKLAFVSFEYAGVTHPVTGGIGNWIAQLAPALAARDPNVLPPPTGVEVPASSVGVVIGVVARGSVAFDPEGNAIRGRDQEKYSNR